MDEFQYRPKVFALVLKVRSLNPVTTLKIYINPTELMLTKIDIWVYI